MQSKVHYCIICSRIGADLHHVKTRKSGGTDDEWNLMPLCRKEHQEIHQIGTTSFVNKYKKARQWLLNNNWEFDNFMKKWRKK